MSKPSEKKKMNCFDDHEHWPASINQLFSGFFLTIMEHTGNIMQDDKRII